MALSTELYILGQTRSEAGARRRQTGWLGVQGLRLWSFLHSSSGSPGFRFGRPRVGVRRPPGLQGAPGAAGRPNLGQGRGCAVMITAKASADSAVPSVHGTAVAAGVPEREEPEWPWKDAPIRALVQRIHQLQAERAQAFRRLEEGHLQYLRSGPPYDFPRYRSTVHEVTQAFAAASREVLAVEAELSGPRGQPLLASHVRSLQQLEQTRLATVLALLLPWVPRPRLLYPYSQSRPRRTSQAEPTWPCCS
ncbi:Hypothetical predicted protein [Lynx pardinus]|uniref:Required for excision 1-B domain-containing protein n=3 Tax=Lynx TaxID=13124 RepID=A0A485NAA1_LYNPA|nr:Hypothetical predicted protein [Lynx pardinus]